MFANSISVILLGILVGLPPLIMLAWGVLHGQFDELEAWAGSIFDDEELQYSRPWEKPSQVQERMHDYGELKNGKEGWRKWL